MSTTPHLITSHRRHELTSHYMRQDGMTRRTMPRRASAPDGTCHVDQVRHHRGRCVQRTTPAQTIQYTILHLVSLCDTLLAMCYIVPSRLIASHTIVRCGGVMFRLVSSHLVSLVVVYSKRRYGRDETPQHHTVAGCASICKLSPYLVSCDVMWCLVIVSYHTTWLSSQLAVDVHIATSLISTVPTTAIVLSVLATSLSLSLSLVSRYLSLSLVSRYLSVWLSLCLAISLSPSSLSLSRSLLLCLAISLSLLNLG